MSADNKEVQLVQFAQSRAKPDGLFYAYCKGCNDKMTVDAKKLIEEFRGSGPWCDMCSRAGSRRPYGGSPQDATDAAYHGSRFHSGEW
jgi:hypothetical protein